MCLTPQTESTIRCNQKQDGMLANFQKRAQVFLYPLSFNFLVGLYSAHKINPNIMKNKTKRPPIFKNVPKVFLLIFSCFYHGRSLYFRYFCAKWEAKSYQNGDIMRALAPFWPHWRPMVKKTWKSDKLAALWTLFLEPFLDVFRHMIVSGCVFYSFYWFISRGSFFHRFLVVSRL